MTIPPDTLPYVIYAACLGSILGTLILLSMVRGIRARIKKRRAPKPAQRFIWVPSKSWCRKQTEKWKN